MSGNEVQSTSSSRWWEFYAVRYGTGTVIGAVVFFFLCMTNPVLNPLLFDVVKTGIDGPKLVLFSAYGLAFCYISSAPILVFHSGRFLFQTRQDARDTLFGFVIALCVPLVVGMVVVGHGGATITAAKVFYGCAAFLFALIVWLQFVFVFASLRRGDELYRFYVRLDKKRAAAKGEIVESYRHLREHGNSFFIVFFEIVLALILYAAGTIDFGIQEKELPKEIHAISYVIILTLWSFPAALVWFVGSYIERRFCDAKT